MRSVTSVISLLLIISQLASPLVVSANAVSEFCGTPDASSPSVSTDYGGVSLDKAATFLADMSDITGSYYDQDRNQLVFVGKKDSTLPKFDKDDLAVAIRSVIFNNTLPAVSIDFKDLKNPRAYPMMDVRYYGGIENTNFGKVLFDADWQLKHYVLGYDDNGNKIVSSVKDYQSVLTRFVAAGPNHELKSTSRSWISPKTITLIKDSKSNSFVFDKVEMQVQAESMTNSNDPAWDKAMQDFAQQQTQYYDQFSLEAPAYAKAKQLAKIVSVVKWIKDNNIVSDYGWVRNYKPVEVMTPSEIKLLITPDEMGPDNFTYNIGGGVQYHTPNTYSEDKAGIATQIKSDSTAASLKSKNDITWSFVTEGKNYDAVAISADVFKTVGAYVTGSSDISAPTTLSKIKLSIDRRYSSFDTDTNVGFGPGWSYMPATLEDLLPGSYVLCNSNANYSGQYPLRIAISTSEGRETFTFNCGSGYVPDNTLFRSKVYRDSTGDYVLKTKDNTVYIFNGSENKKKNNKLKIAYDSNNKDTPLSYNYNDNGDLLEIKHDFSGQSLTISYNSLGQINSVKSLGGTVYYDYDQNGDLVSVSDKKGKATRYTYEKNHLLKTITDRAGTKVVDNTYDDAGKIIKQIDSNNISRSISYNPKDLSVSFVDNNGRTGSTVYDKLARPIKATDALNNSTIYTYGDRSNNPTSITDPLGRKVVLKYDSDGNLVSKIDPDQGEIVNKWDDKGNLVQITDKRYEKTNGSAKVIDLLYDDKGNLTKSDLAGIETKTYTYNPQGLVASITDNAGAISKFIYNNAGLITTSMDPLRKIVNYTYDDAGNLLTIKSIDGLTSYEYDKNGNQTKITTPAGVSNFEYDSNDRIILKKDLSEKPTVYSYNQNGLLASVKNPIDEVMSFDYDSYGNMAKILYPSNKSVSIGYDIMNRESAYRTTQGKIWSKKYDELGNMTTETMPDGTVRVSKFDSQNRKISEKIGTLSYDYVYDAVGRLTKSSSQAGESTYIYDLKDRLTSSTDPNTNNVKYSYDNQDNIAKIKYPNGRIVQNTYDKKSQLISQTDWNGQTITYTYTPFGEISTVKYPNGITQSRTYDTKNLLSDIVYTNSGQIKVFSQTYTRDSNGYITSIKEDGTAVTPQTTEYKYDSLNRLVSSTRKNSSASNTYKYDSLGNMLSSITTQTISGGQIPTVYSTINLVQSGINSKPSAPVTLNKPITSGNLLLVAVSIPSQAIPSTSITDNKGNSYTLVAKTPTVVNGNILAIFAAKNKLNSSTPTTFSTTLTKATLAVMEYSGVDVGTKYIGGSSNSSGKSTSISVDKPVSTTPTLNVAVGWSATPSNAWSVGKDYTLRVSNTGASGEYRIAVADISEKVNTTLSSSVALNVKTSDNWKGLVVSLVPTVKTAGSNTQTTTKTITTNYKYNSDNELVSSVKSGDGIANETSTYTYDKNGNMTSVTSGNTVKTYIWNSSNQLISVKLNNVTGAQFSYDALGNRIAKKGASIIRYVNDISTNANVITEMTNANVPTRMNMVGPLGQISTGDVGNTTRLYPIVDSIGSTRLLTDSSGNIIQKYSFDDYGNKTTVDVVGKPSTQYQFAGENLDTETGLYYLRARYYDPSIGRFISRDPYRGQIDNVTTQNAYPYTADNPINYTDPSGKWFIEFFTGQQSWNSFYMEISDAANTLSNSSAIWDTIISHPCYSGAAIGLSSAAIAYATATAITAVIASGAEGASAVSELTTLIERNGFKFPKDYYVRLWETGRKAPSLIARMIIEGAKTSVPDTDPRFVVYVYEGWKLVIDPITNFVQHLGKI